MIYIGIDNGKKGGLVAIENGQVITKTVMPLLNNNYNFFGIYNYFDELVTYTRNMKRQGILVVLEKVSPKPSDGLKGNFTQGYQYGMIISILKMFHLPYIIVSARKWQTMIQGYHKDTKKASIEYCLDRFPVEDWKATKRCKNNHDGLTDACCMAMYGYMNRL